MSLQVRLGTGVISLLLFFTPIRAAEPRINIEGAETNNDSVSITSVIERTITYQGILKTSTGTPVPDDTYDLTFRIYKQAAGGAALWTSPSIPITTAAGLFSALLGPISLPFDTTYYISIQVAGDVEMSRQKLTMAPYSAASDTANYALNADRLDGQHAGAFAVVGHTHVITSADIQNGTIQFIDIGQNGAAIGQVMKWNGTAWTAQNDSVGSGGDNDWVFRITDTADTTLTSGGRWGLARSGNVLYGNADSTHINLGVACTTGLSGQNYKYCVVGGGYANTANGNYSTIGGGLSNNAGLPYSAIIGGYFNNAGSSASTIGGGYSNTTSLPYAVIGGGYSNTASGYYSSITGGRENTAGGYYSAIGGGYQDTVIAIYGGVFSGYSNLAGDASSDTAAFVGGGYDNSAIAKYAAISGGYSNTASGYYSAIGGGWNNTANIWGAAICGGSFNTSSGYFSVIGGGESNIASGYGSAIGGGAFNTASGDYSAIGGGDNNVVGGAFSAVVGGVNDTLTSLADYSMAFGHTVYLNTPLRVAFFSPTIFSGALGVNRDDRSGGINYPVHVGTYNGNGNGAYLSGGGVWTNGSSRTFKENFTPFDGNDLLRKISTLSVTTYNFKGSTEKHVGPVAEEFVQAFDTGVIRESDGKRDDMYLSAGDVAGVALAGVQELLKRIEMLEKEIAELKTQKNAR